MGLKCSKEKQFIVLSDAAYVELILVKNAKNVVCSGFAAARADAKRRASDNLALE